MRKEKEKIINGLKFKVTQLGFADGMQLLTTLGRIVGPALSSGSKDNPMAMIGEIVQKLTFEEVANITEKLSKTTRIERDPGRWPVLEPEVDLAGNYDLTLRWLGFALEANYSDFFGEGGLLQGVMGKEAMTLGQN